MQNPGLKSHNIESFYNVAPSGLVVYQISGEIVHANETLLKWLGISLETLLSAKFEDFLDKAGKFYYQLFVQPTLKMQREVREINLNICGPVQSFPSLFSAALILDADGKEYIHAAISQVIDRKKYESALLEKKVRAEEEKQLKSLALKEIAFEQAHLVRAPLANILGLIDLIEQMEMTKELSDMISMLRQSSEQLDAQVQSIVKKTNR